MRLDTYLFEQGFAYSRNKAKELILNKKILLNNTIITKASFQIDQNNPPKISLLQERNYVSRAALKLKAFLQEHPIEISKRCCLDIGSSTGGFIEVLLEEGAKEVVGVDVGSDQLHPTLRKNRRVVSVERTDIRHFDPKRSFDVVTCDVSFVGISHILPSIDRLAKEDIVLLFKPQFEVGKEVKRTKKGVVKNEKAIAKALETFEAQTRMYGWQLCAKRESSVKGKEGNVEIFYHFKKR